MDDANNARNICFGKAIYFNSWRFGLLGPWLSNIEFSEKPTHNLYIANHGWVMSFAKHLVA